ncbi:ATP-binding protein [Variovorax sp. IB41]|uniref:ATP-binding protein n=1 Tax=Variovorax sp. IB41 TaxID=2779370 RepID=UPI0018E70BA6|nr:ATP-binding protein [Variovorax sp. IB41]MBJ2159880.1 ATP-binding protein [Variovorax sp. IB41]
MADEQNDLAINASPTKEFFIDILVRDIKLADAIADLIDNCVDGARRLRPNGDYNGLTIDVEFDAGHFSIIDNCGGISIEIAKHYAFRFGRASGMPTTTGSVGQFGVGMKRALFKMGEHFVVESVDPEGKFKVEVDLPTWKTAVDKDGREKWEFEFSELTRVAAPVAQCGTIVEVTKIRPPIAEEFSSPVFEKRVLDVIQSAHEQSIHRGLHIAINQHEIKHRLSTLIVSNSIKPIKIERTYETEDPDAEGGKIPVLVTIYAGISESSQDQAGWYVICNGRQILRADKSRTTGWDDVVNDEKKLPKAHNQFSRFRGFVFFECAKAAVLPWNTMKNAVDPESSLYLAAKLEMASAMRQVIDFLNKLDAEGEVETTALSDAIKAGTPRALSALETSTTFVYPQDDGSRPAPTSVRISYTRPIAEVELAKRFFNVTAAKAVGEKSFEYFLEREST